MSTTSESTITAAPLFVSDVALSASRSLSSRVGVWELPTLGVATAIYGGFFLVTWFFHDLPTPVAMLLIGALLAWYGSLQHETIHGHPTPSRRVNALMGSVPLSLWIPYRIYRLTHLQHHRHGGRHLTEVGRDPESFFLRPGTLAGAGRLKRGLHTANCTLAGRLLLGPAVAVARFWASEARIILRGKRLRVAIWAWHIPAAAVMLIWILGVCRIPFWAYAAAVYFSVSLSHLRSFAEHRADSSSRLRTVVVEADPLMSLIFMNNNLHIAHHAYPKLPWYQLPLVWRPMRSAAVGAGLVFRRGYGEVMLKFLFKPIISAEHPSSGGSGERQAFLSADECSASR